MAAANQPRWTVVVAGFFYILLVWAPYAGLATFFPLLAEDLGTQRGTIAFAFTIVVGIGAPFGVIVGRFLDRPWAHRVGLAELVLCGLGYVLASTMQSLWQLYLYLGLVLGAGFAGAYNIPATIVARWFEEKRGLVVGVVLSGMGVGYLIGPIVAINLLHILGWRGAVLVFGLTASALAFLPALALRNPPNWAGAQPPGQLDPAAPPSGRWTRAATLSGANSARYVLHFSTFWMLFACWALQALAIMMFTIHAVPLVVDKGIEITAAAGVLSLYGIGILAGRILSGQAADKYGSRRTLSVTTTVAAAVMVLLLVTRDLTVIYALAIIFGFTSSGADTAYMKSIPDITGTRFLGAITGFLTFGWRIGAGIGPVLAGFLFDATRVYALPYGLAAAGLLLSVLFFNLASRPERRLEDVLDVVFDPA